MDVASGGNGYGSLDRDVIGSTSKSMSSLLSSLGLCTDTGGVFGRKCNLSNRDISVIPDIVVKRILSLKNKNYKSLNKYKLKAYYYKSV